MPDEPLEAMMIPGHRILVVNDLGPVHKGDHLVMIANVIIAVDTSRRPEDVVLDKRSYQAPEPSSSMPKRTYQRRKPPVNVSAKHVWTVVRDNQPVRSVAISDILGFSRDDAPGRSKVWRILRMLVNDKQVRRYYNDDSKLYVYEIEAGETTMAATE